MENTPFESITEELKEYIGNNPAESNEYDTILVAIVDKYSRDVYKDADKLKKAMRDAGATEAQIAKVHIMTLVTGFREVLEMNECVQKTDIERYVQNAVQETGFNMKQVLELVSAIIISLRIPDITNSRRCLSSGNEDLGFVILPRVYECALDPIEIKLKDALSGGLTSDEILRLDVYAKAGIPRAKCLLGRSMLQQEHEQSKICGLKYLQEAEAAGDSHAALALGDYFYKKGDSDSWSKAYEYYTGSGALALESTQRDNIVDILNYKRFNKATIKASIVIAILMLVTALMISGQLGCTWIPFGVAVGICAVFIIIARLHHKKKPYDSLLWLPCVLCVTWFVYLIAGIIL